MKKLAKKNIEDILALTPMQEGMLFHYLKDPQSEHYFEQLSLEISGEIDVQHFEKAWNVVIEINEMLRTAFRWEEVKEPAQIVLKEFRLVPRYYDLSNSEEGEKRESLSNIKSRDRGEGFDLRQVPFRVTLIKIGEDRYEMVISNHHILYDGWSNGIILREFFRAYHELYQGRVPVSPVKTRFKDFVKWIQGQDADRQKRYWQEYLKGFETPSAISSRKKKEEGKGGRKVGHHQVQLSRGEMEKFVKKFKITLASLLYSAWGILLQKYNNSRDVVFGSTVSGRSAEVRGLEDSVGLFINTIPLRVRTGEGERTVDLLERLGRELEQREAFESTSLVDIRGWSELEGYEELFDSIVVIENYPLENKLLQRNSSFFIQSYEMLETTHYAMTVAAAINDDIDVCFSYDNRLFDDKAIDTINVRRLSHHFKRIVEAMIRHPLKTPAEIDILPEEEKREILYGFNNKESEYPVDKTIHELFEEQVAKTPDAVAIHGTYRTYRTYITYDQLNQKSNQLARYLSQQGAWANQLVGLMVDRSIEMIVGILGTWKAGCAYVPLNPKAPASRLEYMLKECSARILVSEVSKVSEVSGEIELILLDEVMENFTNTPTHLTHLTHPTHLCYVIFTSGSTGTPKGVPITHSNLSPLLHWGYKHLSIGSKDRAIQNLSYYFDWSVWEIFITLTTGAGLYMVPEEVLLNADACIPYMIENNITVLHVTPTQYQYFIHAGRKLETLKYLFLGAEKLTVDLLARSFESVNEDCRVFNMYGPTEATIISAVLEVYRGDENTFEPLSSVPIGGPVANAPLLVLNRELELCPVNITGELYIAGGGLAAGYLNDPAKTCSVFIKNPYKTRGIKGDCLYKTGDLVRWLPDGSIEFSGRLDHQVKIRGYRIELGEIENQLLKHPDVKEALVIAGETQTGGKYLCAYIVAQLPQSILSTELREFLCRTLPDYMIPSFFVPLEKIPLTPNGKLDLRALPEPEITLEEDQVMPRNEVEEKLAETWSEVLGIDKSKISIDSNFFRLGGHSLKVTQLAARIHRELDVKIPLTELFESATIRGQARYIRQLETLEESRYAAIQPAPAQEYYDLSYAQRRLWIICQFEEDSVAYNEVGGLTITGEFNPAAFQQAIQVLAHHHESLRTVFVMVDGEPKQKICEDLEINLEQVDLRHLEGVEQEAAAAEIVKSTANKAFDLEKGPLVVFKLLRFEDDKYFLLVNIHHLINDGWSVGVIKNELNTLYHFFNKGGPADEEIPLPPVKLQYKDYTLWHNRLIDEGYFDQFKSYWLEKFKDKPNGIELPLDHPRGSVQTFNGGRVYYTLQEEETSKLAQLCPEEDTTLFMKLLTLLDILLYKYSGERDIVVGAPIAGRKQPELHHMIGFLVNTLVYRVQVDPGESFRQSLLKVRQETLACYENQDYPFDILVENLGLARDLSRSPLFNVLVAFGDADTRGEELRFDGADVRFHDQVEGFNPSVFDLVFFFNEKGERLDCEIMYNSDLFERSTIQRMATHFSTLVESVLEDQDKPVSALDCIDKREYERIIHRFNENPEDFPELTIQDLVENQVAKSLDRAAVVSPGGQTVTYQELNKRANQLAHYLREEYGIGPGEIVGICIERSIEMVVTVLGVVKSGAGYLSFDPNYPKDRVQHMIKDSRASLVIVDRPRPQLFDHGEETGQTLLNLHDHWHHISYKPPKNPGMLNKLSDIVYIIYTSGSTGTPNGAMLSHAILSNLVQWQASKTAIDGSLRCLQFTSINFCVSFQEIFITLSCGGVVHLIDDIERQDIDYLMDFLVRHKIGNLYLPFSYLNFLFNLFTETKQLDRPYKTSLKHIITAGEQLKITAGLKKFLEQNPWIKLHNHYGSSEMHVVTSYTLDAATASRMPVPPAGKPVANTRIYILDEYERPVPTGVWGELFVDGCAEVPGYIHNPLLTDKKLVWHPVLSPLTGHRLYRSGDVGRWLEDGNIELKGRKDFQVKIRGFRVEPSEIESKILSLDRVKDCVVVVKESVSGEKTLVAYVVTEAIGVMEIKHHLRNYLPQYMIPRFVILESLPLMPNGKVDRERLPEPPAADDTLFDINPADINALLRQEETGEAVEPGLESMIARFTRVMEERLFHKRIKVSGVDVDVLSSDGGEENKPLLPGSEIHLADKCMEKVELAVPAERNIVQLFEDRAAKTPDNIAVFDAGHFVGGNSIHPQTSITYKELNETSNRLASLLRKKGVNRGSVVGLMCRDSVETVTGALGILKAGGAYLAASPDTPSRTVASMLEDSGASMLLTNGRDIKNHSFFTLASHGKESNRQTPLLTPPRRQITDFDGLPRPDRSLVDYDRYGTQIGLAMVRNTITLQASRGCPYHCLYCHKIWPKRHVVRSAENIYREVELYYRMGMRRFVFVDDIYNLDVKNSAEFFELVIKNGLDVHMFFPNGLRSDLLTPDYIDLMVEAGTVSLGIALETASPRLQKLIRKNMNLEKLRENVEYFCSRHPQVVLELFLMHGFPTETEEEALMTLDFLKSLEWVDFPYLHILKIYPNTDMAAMAVEKGVPEEAIERSASLAFHELPDTLPFDKSFTLQYQSDFASQYFLLEERLLAKLPHQMKVLTPAEIVEKYNSYLPVEIKTFADLLQFVGINESQLGIVLDEEGQPVSGPYISELEMKPVGLDAKIRAHFPCREADEDALKILLLDLSQFFSHERDILYDGVEPPLGLMYMLTYLNREFGSRINGKIAKSRVDFDNYDELKVLLDKFKPQVIGIRTLTYYGDFFHETVALLRQWGIDVPVIAGGPYATSDYVTILQDPNVDLVVMSEGELTFAQLIGKIMDNSGQLPDEEVLKEIAGIAFISRKKRTAENAYREILMLDELEEALGLESEANPEVVNQPGDPAYIFYRSGSAGDEKTVVDHGSAQTLCSGLKRRKLAASCLFDGSVGSVGSLQQMFGALVQGGGLCVFSGDTSAEGIELLEFYKEPLESEAGEPHLHIRLQLAEHSSLMGGEYFENETEEKLADIWSDLLGIEKGIIGRDDNFFELGGHSLKATTMMSRIHREFNTRLKLIEIFKAPTIREVAALVQDADVDRHTAILPGEDKEYYVLSAAQKRMYLLQQMEGGIGYNMPRVMILEGKLQEERLKGVINKLIDQHDAFRTSFEMIDEEPVQRIHDYANFEIENYKLQITNKESQENETISQTKVFGGPGTFFQKGSWPPEAIIKDFIRPFDLSKAPLLRVGLIKEEEEKYILMVDMHHIISDGMSIDILVKDFLALYAGKELPVPELAGLRYKDYAEWQQRPAVKEALKQQEEYWMREFEGEIPVLNMPTDYLRPKIQSFEGSALRFEIDSKVTGALKALALEEGATLFMVLLSIYNIFLSKISGQEVIVVGTPTAGRRHADLELVIGMFVNTLALKNDPAAEKKVREFLREVKEKTLAAFANQDYQYEELVENVTVNRDASRNPLFDTMFALQNIDIPTIDIPGLKLKPYTYEQSISKFDLTLQCFETGDHLSFILEYCTKLFKADTIDRFIRYFKQVLRALPISLDARLADIEIISGEEKSQILEDFNNTGTDYPGDKTIHQLFEEQVEKTPDGIAIHRTYRTYMTYNQLNEESTHLAGLLIEKGVKTGHVVGIMGGRSLEMILGIVAILKTGGIYLPIDADYPEERKQYMVKDSNAGVLLSSVSGDIEAIDSIKIIGPIGPIGPMFEKCSTQLSSANPAYIMYTSGSTGQPKGVLVTHRNVVRLVKNTNYVDFGPDTCVLQTGAPVFDATTFEIWGPLLNGGQLVLAPKEVILDAHRLGQAMKAHKVNTLWLSAPLFNQLMQQNIEMFEPLRYLLVGGDVLSPEHINKVRHRFPGLRVINGYGPTENTTFSTTHFIDTDYSEDIPIGRPIANSTAYIVDKHDHLQPVGIYGELLVGGDGVALGYINSPGLTAEKFNRSYRSYRTYIFYKTGDLARWLPDGTIQFGGRIDFQVKIRGFRVELEEIENQLLNVPGINEAIVLAKENQFHDKYLCAYIVTDEKVEQSELKDRLAKKLPDYMVPSYFIPLESMPLNPNGKIDRKALPEPEISAAEDYEAPGDEIEERLVEIWSEVLGIEKDRIGINSDFFQLGGHSLKAAQLIARIEKKLNAKMPLTEIFTAPSVRGLATFIKGAAKEVFSPIPKAALKEYYPVSSAQKRLYVLQKMDEQGIVYNMPTVLMAEGAIDKEKLRHTFLQLIKRHESLRTSFEMVEFEPVQKIHDQVEFEIEYLATEEGFIRPFDLSRAPLMRVGLVRIEAFKHLLMVDMHHIIADGVSMGIMMREFTALYAGEELQLLRLQYKDYCQWQHSLNIKQDMQKQQEYWLKQFQGDMPRMALPTDFERPAAPTFEGSSVYFEIDADVTGALNRLAREEDATLYMVLTAVMNILLSKITSRQDILMGTVLAGRNHPDLEGLIGMFVNTLVLRNYPSEAKTFREFLQEVKARTLEAFENQDYPFEELVEQLGGPRDTMHNPLFDVMFSVNNMIEQQELEIPGLKLTPYGHEHRSAKFDLSVMIDAGDTLLIDMEYRSNLFAQKTIEEFSGYFKDIVSAVLENKETRLADISVSHDLLAAKGIELEKTFNF